MERKNDLIIAGDGLPPWTEAERPVPLLVNLLKNKCRVQLNQNDVVTARRIGKRPLDPTVPDRRPILATFAGGVKTNVAQAFRTIKPPKLYANENLAPNRKVLYDQLRQLRRDHYPIMKHLYTVQGVIHLRKTTDGQPFRIRTKADLSRCLDILGIQVPQDLSDG